MDGRDDQFIDDIEIEDDEIDVVDNQRNVMNKKPPVNQVIDIGDNQLDDSAYLIDDEVEDGYEDDF